MTPARPVLLYDAGCRVCRFAARAVVRLDRERELSLRALEDDEARSMLEPLPEDERPASWRLVRPDGSIVGRGAGAPVLLEAMRLTRPAGRLLAHVPPALLDAAYDLVARNRRRLGRLVPDGPAPRR
jgi:predicted DCC family thiol-disulfide oxidoreductase YuxK